ncbi:MAG: methyltransferase [Pseudomonadota bacterium]|nr:methyltransferase [Pseudomonadota bacterium]MEC8664306.1 methyltransferase [Pseudomonadota bacterium]
MKRKFLGLALCSAVLAFSGIAYAEEALQAAVSGEHRTVENKARDTSRHPLETLQFFEVQPDHTVVEINPGGGWYTEILGPYLKDEGTLYLAVFADDSEKSYAPRLNAKSKEMTANKELYGNVQYGVMDTPNAVGPVAPAGSADRVLTFRNVHNWMADGSGEAAFVAFYEALKPGGILGVVEHRAKADKEQDPKAVSGYVREDYVIGLAEAAGFELVEKSEINANPKDTADHPEGVWTLPPRFRLGEQDREKYQEIGESDRMTLKFVKPLN